MTSSVRGFKKRFKFNPNMSFRVGVERESFLTRNGVIVPIAEEVLGSLQNGSGDRKFGFELSACQLEERIGPCDVGLLKQALKGHEENVRAFETKFRFRRDFQEVAPEDMPLDVYPDPAGRYQGIVAKMPKDVLLAACRVIGTHIHIGMPNHETALLVYNRLVEIGCVRNLLKAGDGSQGRRLEIYKIVAPEYMPPKYADWRKFYEEARRKGFHTDPRSCWTLIRVSVHGTIEFRTFGATENLDKIAEWARNCHSLCLEALAP